MKFIKIFFKVLLTLIVAYLAIPYLLTPAYNFREPSEFYGETFYNPYSEIENLKSFKANFHYHSNTWGFLTDGRSRTNTADNILKNYQNYGYHIAGISDYMSINPASIIPVYEHGMGIRKTHQLVIGSSNVTWFDFILPHKTNHKQFMINMLKTVDNLVVLAHPSWYNAYTPDDVKKLGNYNCMEILSTNRESLALWDTALSAGVPVFMLANDDGHNAVNPNITGRIFNIIYAKDLSSQSIIKSLKEGKNIAYEIPLSGNTSAQKKYHNEIIMPENISIEKDTIHIIFNDTIKTIRLKGQGGVVLSEAFNTAALSYPVKPSDTYMRCEAELNNGTRIFMNPIIRGSNILNDGSPSKNLNSTMIFSTFMWLFFAFALYLFWRPKRK